MHDPGCPPLFKIAFTRPPPPLPPKQKTDVERCDAVGADVMDIVSDRPTATDDDPPPPPTGRGDVGECPPGCTPGTASETSAAACYAPLHVCYRYFRGRALREAPPPFVSWAVWRRPPVPRAAAAHAEGHALLKAVP